VLVCNHGSYLDGVVLVAALPRPCAFVAKSELAPQFVAGRFLRALGAEFVERFDARRSADDGQRLAQRVRGERPLLVFPEGTFRAGVTLLPFHLGAFIAAAQAPAPVLPITLTGTRNVLPEGRWWPRHAALAVHIDAPIEPETTLEPFTDAVRLRDAAQSALARRLGAWAEG
jgi:1-acyl-sn-glycerol-3-phosphate acyltransferase